MPTLICVSSKNSKDLFKHCYKAETKFLLVFHTDE